MSIKAKTKMLVTATGFSVDDALNECRTDMRKRPADRDVLTGWRRVFDSACDRARSFYMLSCMEKLSKADRAHLLACRDGHQRLAIGLAKLLWKVE